MRKRSFSILALILGIVFTGYVILSFWTVQTSGGFVSFESGSGPIISGENDTAFGGLFEMVHLSDTLPYYKYRRQEDSIKNILDKRDRENKSEQMGGMMLGVMGVYYITSPQQDQLRQQVSDKYAALMGNVENKAAHKEATTTNKDSLQMIRRQSEDSVKYYENEYNRKLKELEENSENLYYFGLMGYSLPERTRFFIQNGTYNLAYVKWDSISKEGHQQYGHYERKQIPVRYSAGKKLIYIPISKTQFGVLNTTFIIIAFGFVFLVVYLFVGLPLQILINISKGKAFDERNIRRFTIMYRTTLVTVLLYLIMPYILWIGFHKMIPGDFMKPSFWGLLWDWKWLILVTIVLFLIGKAFQKGNSLQREQDLTI